MARSATTTDAFNAIAEQRRREIIDLLAGHERSVGELVKSTDATQPQISKHLRVLREVGLVNVRRDGRVRWYRLNAAPLQAVHDWVRPLERFWDHQLALVKACAEGRARDANGPHPLHPEPRNHVMLLSTNQDVALLHVDRSIEVAAPIRIVFDSLIEQLGPAGETPEGAPLPMKLEAWPGGRWYRDLGDGNGHFWGTVQAIKAPTLIEICGPLFMSYAAISNLQYRLTEQGDSTTIDFHHRALGEIDPEHREGIENGWDRQLQRIKERAEARGEQG